MISVAPVAAFLLLGTPCPGNILHVPSPYPTIQSAINAAVTGDEVVVANGTYSGHGNAGISLLGKSITVRSESGDPSTCTIDGQRVSGTIVNFYSGETSACVVDGLTITGGADVGGGGGGIYISGSSPTIHNCVVENNINGDPSGFPGYGGGINIRGASSPDISDCVITRNGAAHYHTLPSEGGGVYCESHTAVLRNCTLTNNGANLGGGFYGDGTMIDCQILDNTASFQDPTGGLGGGVNTQGASLSGCVITGNLADLGGGGLDGWSCTIAGCTIAGNRCGGNPDQEGGGGGLYIGAASVTLTIVWGNCSTYQGDDIASWGNPVLTCCCVDPSKIHGTVTFDGDQVYQDPLFCGPEPCISAPTLAGDYTLSASSPCLPSAHSCGSGALIGALPQGCSGPVPIEEITWGRVKSRFK